MMAQHDFPHDFPGDVESLLPVTVATICARDGAGPFVTIEQAARHLVQCALSCAQCRESAAAWLARLPEPGGDDVSTVSVSTVRSDIQESAAAVEPSMPGEQVGTDGARTTPAYDVAIESTGACGKYVAGGYGVCATCERDRVDHGGVCEEYDPAGPGSQAESDGYPQCANCGYPRINHPGVIG